MVKLGEAIRAAKSFKISHAQKFAQHVVPEVVRPARVIWNQAIGAIFVLLAVWFISYAATHRDNHAAVAGGAFLGAIMLYFGVGSFRQARRI